MSLLASRFRVTPNNRRLPRKFFRRNTYKKKREGLPSVLNHSSSRLRHEYHLRRFIHQRRPIKISIHRAHSETTPRQQMLHLVPEEISQSPSKHQPRLFPSRIRYIKNHLHIITLLRPVKRRDALHNLHAPPVRHRILRHQPFFLISRVMHALRIRLKNIQNQPPATLPQPLPLSPLKDVSAPIPDTKSARQLPKDAASAETE